MVNAAQSSRIQSRRPAADGKGEGLAAREFDRLAAKIRACRICRDEPNGAPLPHDPRPVFRVSPTAVICVAGQAPGTRVHASGIPFADPSGDRLRAWMGIDPETFYDASRIAIVPMGFCYPGQDVRGADLPPRRECAPVWRPALFSALPRLKLLLAVGAHAQNWHLGPLARPTLSGTVANWREIMVATSRPTVIPLPHPSWRNNAWLKKNPWFDADLLPVLQKKVGELLALAD